jgi:hypothetical protein
MIWYMLRTLITPDPDCWELLPYEVPMQRVSDWKVSEA